MTNLQKANKNPVVVFETSKGTFKVELFKDLAPVSVGNFLSYVQNGFYDETIFHRVISNFMIQGGGYKSDMTKKQTKSPIRNEANNQLKNDRGTIAVARTQDPHSGTSQFFINVQDNPSLNYVDGTSGRNWGYAVFGKVIEGMDVIDAIKNVSTGSKAPFRSDVPVVDIVMKRVYLK
ncbi:MAG: peptidylprolyl isomerase [Marinicella sp.]